MDICEHYRIQQWGNICIYQTLAIGGPEMVLPTDRSDGEQQAASSEAAIFMGAFQDGQNFNQL